MPSPEQVQAAERQIVEAVVDRALHLGYSLTVWNGGEEPTLDVNVDRTQILEAMFEAAEERLILREANGDYLGFVRLVYGANGYDVVADYSFNLEPAFLPPIHALEARIREEIAAA